MDKSYQPAKRKLASVAAVAVLVVGALSANTVFAGGLFPSELLNAVTPPVVAPIINQINQTAGDPAVGAAIVEYLAP